MNIFEPIKSRYCLLPVLLLAICQGAAAQQFILNDATVTNVDNHPSFGAAWVDYDADGDEDLFVVHMQAPNSLFRNDGNSKFSKVPFAASDEMPPDSDPSFSTSWADFNNDGRLDVFVGNFGTPSRLFEQMPDGVFRSVFDSLFEKHGATVQGSSWVDVDRDGDLDLFLATKDQPDVLFENLGSDGFQKMSQSALDEQRTRSHDAAWSDIDLDGYPELFVADNSEAGNRLFANDAGNLRPTAMEKTPVVSIGATWVDFDNDLDLDLFVSNALGKPDELFENDNGTLAPAAANDLTSAETNSMGACWGDYDNDGDQDVLIANSGNQANSYFRNVGNGQFDRVADSVLSKTERSSRGCTNSDYDNDGDLDVFVSNGFGDDDRNQLFTNSGNDNNWVVLTLVGMNMPTPIGARVLVSTGDGRNRQMREVASSSGAYGHNSLNVHFGLGTATDLDAVTVRWPDGDTENFENLEVNRRYRLTQGTGSREIEAAD